MPWATIFESVGLSEGESALVKYTLYMQEVSCEITIYGESVSGYLYCKNGCDLPRAINRLVLSVAKVYVICELLKQKKKQNIKQVLS